MVIIFVIKKNGIWILGFGIWILEFGFWILGLEFWDLDFGIWDLDFGIWILGFGIWNLEFSTVLRWVIKTSQLKGFFAFITRTAYAAMRVAAFVARPCLCEIYAK